MQETCKIFFSWQSDVKGSRNLISDCLKKVPSKLNNLAIIEISRDTEGISGAPNIGDTIFSRIETADIFVADVSVINGDSASRKVPNPNVLIELGYAIKALGWERIILVHNVDTAEIEELPFDINHQRIVTFSLNGDSKAQARNKIIQCISSTIEILKEKKMLHGGQPDVAQACRELRNLIVKSMRSVFSDYVNRHFKDIYDDFNSFVPIWDSDYRKLELAKKRLTEQQYYDVSQLLHKLQMASVGTTNAYGWEYAEELAVLYFDEIYREYGDLMVELSFECVLTPDFIELMNALDFDENYGYSPERYCDGILVFSNDGEYQEAYDKMGNLLCKGTVNNGLFTGFRKTDDYIGEFVNSKKHGIGKEFTNLFRKSRYGCGTYRRTGTWLNDKYVEGRIYSVVLIKHNDSDWVYEYNSVGEIMTADDIYLDDYLCTLSPEDIKSLYFADVILKDGVLEICDESVRAAMEYESVQIIYAVK